MTRVRITHHDFDSFRSLMIRERWDHWPAVFSINPAGGIWPWIRNGWTPQAERQQIGGLSLVVDTLGEALLFVRPLGGRFFVDERGAWIKPEGQFAKFEFES